MGLGWAFPKTVVVVISGKAGVGKSTFADLLKQVLSNRIGEFQVEKCAFAGGVKDCAREYFGWNGVKDEKGRRLLQLIGTEIGRFYNQDIWVEYLLNALDDKRAGVPPSVIIVDDWRFPSEADYFSNRPEDYDLVKVRIIAPDREILTGIAAEHTSEIALPDDEGVGYYNCMLDNSGSLTELTNFAIDFADYIMIKEN